MSKVKENVNKLYFPMYDYQVDIIITDSIKKSRSNRNVEIGEKFDARGCLGLHTSIEEEMKSYIFLKPNSSAGTIAHECFHCTSAIMTTIGTCMDDSSEEVYAYTLTYLVDIVTNQIKQIKKESKIKQDEHDQSSLS